MAPFLRSRDETALTRMSIGIRIDRSVWAASDEFRAFVPQHQPIARHCRFKLCGVHESAGLLNYRRFTFRHRQKNEAAQLSRDRLPRCCYERQSQCSLIPATLKSGRIPLFSSGEKGGEVARPCLTMKSRLETGCLRCGGHQPAPRCAFPDRARFRIANYYGQHLSRSHRC
jgi:hypothetical protein